MTIRNLDRAFAPRSIALVGASERPGSLGALVLSNILAGGFEGQIFAINPKYRSLSGLPCYSSVKDNLLIRLYHPEQRKDRLGLCHGIQGFSNIMF